MDRKQKMQSPTHTLHIKNMVCDRCIRVVREELARLGHDVRSIALGEAVIAPPPDAAAMDDIRRVLEENGFELLDNRKARLVERTKAAVIQLVHRSEAPAARGFRLSEYVEREVGTDYATVSALFSSMENVTIERYLILQRIERVKELIKYDELTLSEIAFRLGYSSVAHLSNQFKKVTGLSPSAFRAMHDAPRRGIDRV